MQKENKGVVLYDMGAAVALVLIFALIIVAHQTKQEREKKVEQYVDTLIEEWEEAYKKPDFYGEKLIVASPPEEAFELFLEGGKLYIDRYRGEDKPKVDYSICSYASFDPNFPNTLMIWLYNQSHFPIEMDYFKDRYYVQSYGRNIYQLEIDMEWDDYNKVMNPQDQKLIWVKYPTTISKTDIKNIVIKLARGNIVIALQKIPR